MLRLRFVFVFSSKLIFERSPNTVFAFVSFSFDFDFFRHFLLYFHKALVI